MKACKIILIIFLVIKSLALIIKALLVSDEDQLENVLKAFIGVPVTWLLYWGAGLLDF